MSGELKPAVFARNDHAEESMILEKLPHFRGEIVTIVGDVPIINHGAELFDRTIEKCLLRFCQHRLVITQQLNDWFAPVLATVLIYAVTVSVIWSGLDYIITWGRRARRTS